MVKKRDSAPGEAIRGVTGSQPQGRGGCHTGSITTLRKVCNCATLGSPGIFTLTTVDIEVVHFLLGTQRDDIRRCSVQ